MHGRKNIKLQGMQFNSLTDKTHEAANVIRNNTWQKEPFLFLIHHHKMKT